MKNIFSERGQANMKFAIILMALAAVGMFILFLWGEVDKYTKTHKFDRDFATGTISITGLPINFGEINHPQSTSYDGFIPEVDDYRGRYGLGSFPRLISVYGCNTIFIDYRYSTLYAATTFPAPEVITIQMPFQSGSYANVCGPKDVRVNIIVWGK